MDDKATILRKHLEKSVKHCVKALDMACDTILEKNNNSPISKFLSAPDYKFITDLLKAEVEAKLVENPPKSIGFVHLYAGLTSPLDMLWKVIAEDPSFARLCEATVESTYAKVSKTNTRCAPTNPDSQFVTYTNPDTHITHVITFSKDPYSSLLHHVIAAEKEVSKEEFMEGMKIKFDDKSLEELRKLMPAGSSSRSR